MSNNTTPNQYGPIGVTFPDGRKAVLAGQPRVEGYSEEDAKRFVKGFFFGSEDADVEIWLGRPTSQRSLTDDQELEAFWGEGGEDHTHCRYGGQEVPMECGITAPESTDSAVNWWACPDCFWEARDFHRQLLLADKVRQAYLTALADMHELEGLTEWEVDNYLTGFEDTCELRDDFPTAEELISEASEMVSPQITVEELDEVMVDSGGLLVIDPGYIATDGYRAAQPITVDDIKNAGKRGSLQHGCLIHTHSDGVYRITSEKDGNGRIVRATIHVLDDDELLDDQR